MPVKRGKDTKGCFYQWGSQKKYYYSCEDTKSRRNAYNKARRQAKAIYSSGYKG
jgi:hypothetical protein